LSTQDTSRRQTTHTTKKMSNTDPTKDEGDPTCSQRLRNSYWKHVSNQ